MKARRQNAVSAKGNLFALAEAVSLMYGQDGSEAATEELREVALDYRAVVKAWGQQEWLSYVIRLLFACPVLLTRPPGFEWLTDDLRWALQHRRLNPDVERDLWGAWGGVRGRLRSGRPGDKGKDLFRYEMVQAIMHPVTTDPEKGLVRVKGCSKTAAVTTLMEMEERLYRRVLDAREIWRSLQRVEDYLARMKGQLEQGKESKTGHPLKHA